MDQQDSHAMNDQPELMHSRQSAIAADIEPFSISTQH